MNAVARLALAKLEAIKKLEEEDKKKE